jgi:hypothetical protein
MIFIGLVIVSCSKQEVVPNKDGEATVAPTWRSADASGVVLDDSNGEGTVIIDPTDPNNGAVIDGGLPGAGGVLSGGEIIDPTDPNNN